MYSTPENLFYTKEHEWIKAQNNKCLVGITDYAQQKLRDVVYADMAMPNSQIKIADVVCSLESVKAVSDVYSPVSGKIIQINEHLETKPELINTSPYAAGWICEIEMQYPDELEAYMDTEEYIAFVKSL